MASVAKFSRAAVRNQLRHNAREIENSSNPDIDYGKTNGNYVLSPDRGISDYDYFKQRMSEVYCYGRDDIKVMAGWVLTAPKDLPVQQYEHFFEATYDFLENRYGAENVVQAIVHSDESGQPHMHFDFIPIVEDRKHEQGEKVCANDVLTRRELRSFHGDWERYLSEHGIDAHVQTGITRLQGGNRTVGEMKAEREIEHTVDRDIGHTNKLHFGTTEKGRTLHF